MKIQLEVEMKVGSRVRALRNIVNEGEEGNPQQKDIAAPDFLYSHKGGVGTIEHIDDFISVPTVRFDETGCATIVNWGEIEEVNEEED